MRHLTRFATAAALLLLATTAARASSLGYVQTNLVSDVAGMAQVTDPNLKNPWGISFSTTSPVWISNQGTGTASLYSLDGTTLGAPTPPGSTGNFVDIPPQGSSPPHGPTGQVFAGGDGFTIPAGNGGGSPNFIFATLDGSIEGWVSGNMNARLGIQVAGATFTGLALASVSSNDFLYAADFKNGVIDVFNTSFTNVTETTFAGKFVDPNLPLGFNPYNITLINGNLYVAYAQPLGIVTTLGGYIDEYTTSGNLIAHVASDGPLLGPWGMALAPANFGPFSNDLLVGNFGNGTNTGGNGTIAAYNSSGTFEGLLTGADGTPIAIPGLWSLAFGNGGSAGTPSTLFFTAGLNGQTDGLFGTITVAVPEPASLVQASLALLAGTLFYACKHWRQPTLP